MGMGIVGEYLYRVLEETKKIPNYMIRRCEVEVKEEKKNVK